MSSSLNGTGVTFSDSTTQSSGQQAAKAWIACNYNGGSAVSNNASYNVSSLTRNGTGDYTINFTNALADANYSIGSCAQYSGTNSSMVIAVTKTTTSLRVYVMYANGTNGAATNYDYGFFVSIFR